MDQTSEQVVLAIETSGECGSVVLGSGSQVLEARRLSSTRRHAADLMPAIDELLRRAGLTPQEIKLVCVSAGPGSFTGLRIGITVARMIAFAGQAKIVAVPTLQAIAQNALSLNDPRLHAAVILDAKRRRTYAGTFVLDRDTYKPLDSPAEVEPHEYLASRPRGCVVLGEGVRVHRAAVEGSGLIALPEEFHAARAECVLRLGVAHFEKSGSVNPRDLVPVYIRPPEPEEKLAHKQVIADAQSKS